MTIKYQFEIILKANWKCPVYCSQDEHITTVENSANEMNKKINCPIPWYIILSARVQLRIVANYKLSRYHDLRL